MEEYRKLRMETAAERWGPEGAKTAELILAEQATALREGGCSDLKDLAVRLGVSDSLFASVFEWLRGEGRLLRENSRGQQELVPADLRFVIEPNLARKQHDVTRARTLLRDGTRSWTQLGMVLPRRRLQEIEAVKEFSPATDEEAALMVRSLVRVESLPDTSSIQYWLRRIRGEGAASSALMETLFSDRGLVRLRATELLAGFDEPAVRRQLHRVATEDPERPVRMAALTTLSSMQVEELWPLISQEACETRSPYQANAVAALRLFLDERSVATLRQLVASRDQPAEVRTEAIETLATLGTSEAVKSLVEIGLGDANAEDRNNAAVALGSVASRERAREAVDEIRRSELTLEQDEPFTWRGAASTCWRSVVSVLVALRNFALHGAALISLGHYRSGLLFFGLEVLITGAIAWRAHNLDSLEVLLSGLWWTNWLGSQLLASYVSILHRRRIDSAPEGRLMRNKQPLLRLGTPLEAVLLCADLAAFFCVHGLAHALAGRSHRALKLFGLECFGIVCFAIAWFFSGTSTSIAAFSPNVSRLLMWVYGGTGALLFLGTFFWDVISVFHSLAIHPRRLHGWERRTPLYASIARNPFAAEYLLERAAEHEGESWARRVVRRTSQGMPVEQLISVLKAQTRRPRYLLEILARIKNHALLQGFRQEWQGATPRLRRWMVDVLAGKPNEASLEQLASLKPDLDRYGRLRYAMAIWHYRLRLWPSMVLLVSAILLPLPVLMGVEFYAWMIHPARPVLRMAQTAQMRLRMDDDQLLQTLEFVAKTDTGEPPKVLREPFVESAKLLEYGVKEGRWQKGFEKLGTAVCSLPAEASGAHKESIDALRGQLATVLIDALRTRQRWSDSDRKEAEEALSMIGQNRLRCDISSPARRELARVAVILEHDKREPEEELAVATLDASGGGAAIEPLKRIALERSRQQQQSKRKASDEIQADPVALRAVEALSRNRSKRADDALKSIGEAKDLSIARAANELLDRRYEAMIAEASGPMDRGDYEAAYNQAVQLLGSIPEGRRHDDLLDILSESTYQLAVNAKTGSKDWATISIGYLLAEKEAENWSTSKRSKLAMTYAVRAQYQIPDNARALEDAQKAIDVDPNSYLGYCTKAWVLQLTGKPQDSIALALTGVRKDPHVAWSYSLIQNAYVRQAAAARNARSRQRLLEAGIDQLTRLMRQHPDVMWPERDLSQLYHDHYAEFDPKSFEIAYERLVDMRDRFGSTLTEEERENLNADYLEALFTVGKYKETATLAGELEQRLSSSNSGLRIPVQLYRYAALAMQGDSNAETQLFRLEELVSSVPGAYDPGWIYEGSLNFLASHKGGEIQQQLAELMKVAGTEDKNTQALQRAIRANRARLRADGLQASRGEH